MSGDGRLYPTSAGSAVRCGACAAGSGRWWLAGVIRSEGRRAHPAPMHARAYRQVTDARIVTNARLNGRKGPDTPRRELLSHAFGYLETCENSFRPDISGGTIPITFDGCDGVRPVS